MKYNILILLTDQLIELTIHKDLSFWRIVKRKSKLINQIFKLQISNQKVI